MTQRQFAGGAATAGGMNFQHRVAAWVAAHILAEKDATPPWDLPVGTTLDWLRCETNQPVDDLVVGTSADGRIFAQMKRTLSLSPDAKSRLASSLDQFVRQFIACRGTAIGTLPGDRPLDPARDRLLLVTSSKSSQPIRVHLRAILRRMRNQPAGQSLDDVAANETERRALSIVLAHVTRSWEKTLGTAPSQDEIWDLMSCVNVQVLDMEEGCDGDREARGLLRSAVLRDPDHVDTAWSRLISFCADLAAERSGVARLDLQRSLLQAGLQLKTLRSYQDDIEKLREYSAITFAALAPLAEIRVGSTAIKIQRPTSEALCSAAEENSILVVGEPGAGKSGALHDLVTIARERAQDFILLVVDRLAAQSLGQLRDEIGLVHELPLVLDNWPGTKPAFLVIDALDAARGDPAGAMIRDLMRKVNVKGSRWHIVASIRKFDLRYGVEIKQMFAGSPVQEFQDEEFKAIRHLNIPHFSDNEMGQLTSQSTALQVLVSVAPVELRDLLRVPFNLRLMAELLGEGITLGELTPIRSQLELLDRYWRHRVIRDDGQGDAREAVLRNACEEMVQARALRIDRAAVAGTGSSAHLDDLLSAQVLVEWPLSPGIPPDRYIIAFSHHVLFDYGVSTLLFRGTANAVVRRLENDPDLAVVVRPSLHLNFRHLWNVDGSRRQFWNLVLQVVQVSRIPEIGMLIGPSVAAELATNLSDLEAVCTAMEDCRSENQGAAERVLRHIVGALLAGTPGDSTLVGYGAGPWCQFLERMSRNLKSRVAYLLRPLVSTICDHPEKFTPDQRLALGHTARRLLDFAWTQIPRDGFLVIHSIQCVCRTFESDVGASAALIRRCLEPLRLQQFGYEEMPWLAREVKRLIPIDAPLVEEICCAAFAFEELSDEDTPIGGSRILPLISNRRQDYRMAHYELANVFPEFLKHAPRNAVRALIAVTEAYFARRHAPSSGEVHEATFDFDGRQARLCSDYSSVWDGGDTYRHDEPLKMIDAFQQFLEGLAEKPENAEDLRAIVHQVISENRLAVLWRRVLFAGARCPSTLGREILPLAWAMPILTSVDTTTPAGEFLRMVFPTLNRRERERVELTILEIPEVIPEDRKELAEHLRNRLLGCLTDSDLITEEALRVMKQLRDSDAIPSNEPPKRFTAWSRPYGEEEFLRDQGVPFEDEVNRNIRLLERPVKEFGDKHLNSEPTLDEISNVFPSLQALSEALSRAETDGVHPKQRNYAWGCLSAACARIARAEGLSCDDPTGLLVKAVILSASLEREPVYDPAYDAQFDESPSWGSPAPRIEAAEGLLALARHATCSSQELLGTIERLSNDPVPAVRYQIASRLNMLYRAAPELMWRLIERVSHEEPSRGVLLGFLNGCLQRVAGAEPDRVASLTKAVFSRVTEGAGAARVRELCVSLFTDLYIWRGQAECRDIILDVATNTSVYRDEAPHLLAHLRQPLTHGPTDPADPDQDTIRHRALDLLRRLLRSGRDGLDEIEQRHSGVPFSSWAIRDQESTKSLARLLDSVGREVYSASGAFMRNTQGHDDDPPLTWEQAKRFYREAVSILDDLADVNLPSVTHHLLETLEIFAPIDPRGVFVRIGTVVRAGKKGGYQYESLAADLIVKLVERYLAEYRVLLRDDLECRNALIEILDVFVHAGWPNARRLTYRLEEIFR